MFVCVRKGLESERSIKMGYAIFCSSRVRQKPRFPGIDTVVKNIVKQEHTHTLPSPTASTLKFMARTKAKQRMDKRFSQYQYPRTDFTDTVCVYSEQKADQDDSASLNEVHDCDDSGGRGYNNLDGDFSEEDFNPQQKQEEEQQHSFSLSLSLSPTHSNSSYSQEAGADDLASKSKILSNLLTCDNYCPLPLRKIGHFLTTMSLEESEKVLLIRDEDNYSFTPLMSCEFIKREKDKCQTLLTLRITHALRITQTPMHAGRIQMMVSISSSKW